MSKASPGVETKVAAGVSTTVFAGYVAWALVTYVPGLKDTIPLDLQGQLPVMVAFALSAVVSYFAPHTHRPDLDKQVEALAEELVARGYVPSPPPLPISRPQPVSAPPDLR